MAETDAETPAAPYLKTPAEHGSKNADLDEETVQEIPDGQSYREGEVRGKELPGYLVRSTGLLSHLGSVREEWAVQAIAAHLSDVTERSDSDAIRYRNRHTGTEHTVERREGTIHKSRQSFVEDVRRRIWKKAAGPQDREHRAQWSDDFERDYDRLRHAIDRLGDEEFLVNEGPAVQADEKPVRDRNGRRWRVDPSFRRMPDADPQRLSVRCTGPEPEIDRDALHIDVLDALERLVAYRENLHEGFTAGWKTEKRGGEWQRHEAKTDAARSHQWTARNCTDRPQFISVGRWRPEEIEEEGLKGERAVTEPFITLDLDADTWQQNARHTKTLVDLLSEHTDQLDRIVVSHTGGKSFHVRIPAGFLGNRTWKNADAAARELSDFVDALCEGHPKLRETIDDRVLHPRQVVRMIGSTYEEDTAPPDNSSWRPWLVNRLCLRPQIKDRDHAKEVADEVLDFLHDRHLPIEDVELQFEGERAVTITNAPDRTPNTNRVVACTAREVLEQGANFLRARSESSTHQPFDIPDPTKADHVPSLTALLPDRPDTPHTEGVIRSVARQPSTGEYERALQVEEEGEKWGRDVDKPHLVGRNRAALTISMVRLTYSTTPWKDVRAWNGGLVDSLDERELRKTFRSAKNYV